MKINKEIIPSSQLIEANPDCTPAMPPGMLLVNDEPTPVLVGKSAAAASLLSQYFYEDYESVRVTVRDRSPVESEDFLSVPSGDKLWLGDFK